MGILNQQCLFKRPWITQDTNSLGTDPWFVSYWFLNEELKPYRWILAGFMSLSYVCAGRKRGVRRTSNCFG